MQKLKINKIGVLSVAKIYGVMMFVTAFLISVPLGIINILFGAGLTAMLGADPNMGGDAQALAGLAGGVVGGLVFMCALPFLYGILGFIGGAIGAFLYNLFARFVGGVEITADVSRAE